MLCRRATSIQLLFCGWDNVSRYDQVVSDEDRFVDYSGQDVFDAEQDCNDVVIKRMMMVVAVATSTW